MTGMAAIAFCAAFTSCSKDENLYDPKAIEEMEIAQIYENYNQAFIATFGQPAANQNWGFGATRGITRTYNVNGNQWHDPDYFNLEYDGPVTTAEKNLVFNYVNNPTNVRTVDQISFDKYWVAQIWNGNTDANASNVKSPKSTSYPDQNGATTTTVGGAHMDKLDILEFPGTWTHCNNFNAADNNDWIEEEKGGVEGRTLMWESGTLSFRYINSDGSHMSERYIIVPGENIDASLKGFYYVCFDFEKGYTDAEKAAETSYGTCEIWKSQATDQNPNAGYWQGGENWNLPGFYNDASSADLQSTLETQKGTKVRNITFKGYLYGQQHYVGDGYYNDWIVRISPAKVVTTSGYDFRVIAEDLNAESLTAEAAKGGLTESDWDFNDVVFDAKWKNDNTATIKVKVVGGVLPLYIGNAANPKLQEVHELFGAKKNSDGLYSILGARDDAPEFDVTGLTKSLNGKDIVISVVRSLSTGEEALLELKADTGTPAAKIRVETRFNPCAERDDIRIQYPLFSDWVTSIPEISWY